MNNSKLYILLANLFDGSSRLLWMILIFLLSIIFFSGLVNISNGIPYITDKVKFIDHVSCINFIEWETDRITTDRGYLFFYDNQRNDYYKYTIGESIILSFFQARLGWFHMGTCEVK